jgi:molybdate transport system substrate-binding protein
MLCSRRWAVLAAACWLASGSGLRAEVLVSAASSLTDVFTLVAARYERLTGERVLLNLGASNTLARQIASGAKVDVFVSADEAQMNRVAADVMGDSRVALLSNRLALAVPRGRPAVRGFKGLLAPTIRRVAIADPAAVPAGVYARNYLESLGLWPALQSKLVPTGSVRLALAAVESGTADAAVVYVTDVSTARGASLAFVLPATEGPRIVYPAAVLKRAPNRAGARRFLTFLQGEAASAIFTAAGFGVLSPTGRP